KFMAKAITKKKNGGKVKILLVMSRCLLFLLLSMEPTLLAKLLTRTNDPGWSISTAIFNPSAPYNASIMGIPIKEVFAKPAVMMRQPIVPLSQFLILPIWLKASQDKKKPIQATKTGRISSVLIMILGICNKARA